MAINIGENPWFLIAVMFLELLFIIIPSLIASKVEKKTIKDELNEMGFHKNEDPILKNVFKVIIGIAIGIVFFLIGEYIIIFFKQFVVEQTFGSAFVREGEEHAISTTPIQPDVVQLIILIVLQVFLVGVCEEAFFRGFIMNKCQDKLKLLYAVVISSSCFAIYHVPPFIVPLSTIFTYFGYYFTFGILLALVFLSFERSLIPCIVAHASFNILILILF